MSMLSATRTHEQVDAPERYMTLREFAQLARIPYSTAWDYATTGALPGVTRIKRHIRLDRQKVETWLEQGGTKAAA